MLNTPDRILSAAHDPARNIFGTQVNNEPMSRLAPGPGVATEWQVKTCSMPQVKLGKEETLAEVSQCQADACNYMKYQGLARVDVCFELTPSLSVIMHKKPAGKLSAYAKRPYQILCHIGLGCTKVKAASKDGCTSMVSCSHLHPMLFK